MTSKKLWRHRAATAPATGAGHADGMNAEDAAFRLICDESQHSNACEVNAQESAELQTICEGLEELEQGQTHSIGQGVQDAALCTICEEEKTDDGNVDWATLSMGNACVCAICGQLLERESYGCVHTGHWHGAYEDCGIRCLQLGSKIGKQHWGCCYQADSSCVGCSRAKHVPMVVNRFTSGVDAVEFYSEYHGHRPEHLSQLVHSLRNQGVDELVWLAGDSTLDNKYWLFQGDQPDLLPGATDYSAAAINGYENVLVPPRMVMDVAYQLNKALQERMPMGSHGFRRIAAVNASYEEGTLSDRAGDKLLPQDAFIRSHISPQDTLVVSVGGNDVALKPSVKTAMSALAMSRMASLEAIEAGKATGQGHFYSLFHTETKQYVKKLIARTKPRRVLICTLYFLDEAQTGSWADTTLGYLGYNDDPSRLQAAIRHVFETATSTIQLEGVEVIPIPLFQALDGKTSSDYDSRVEPSVTGGEKMARLLADAIIK